MPDWRRAVVDAMSDPLFAFALNASTFQRVALPTLLPHHFTRNRPDFYQPPSVESAWVAGHALFDSFSRGREKAGATDE